MANVSEQDLLKLNQDFVLDIYTQILIHLHALPEWRYEAREIPIVQELDAKVKELRQTIAALNNNQMSLRASFRKLKEKTGEMDEKRAIEERKSAREEAMNAERSAMQTYHEKSAIVEVYTKVHRKMSKHFLQMQAIQEQHIATRLPDLHNS